MRLTFEEARTELDRFVRVIAPPHYATTKAPSTYAELVAWYEDWRERAHARGEHFVIPVSSEFCEGTIYRDPAGNHAFRAWHDSLHLARELDFTPESELKLACSHQRIAAAHGVSLDARWLLWCDTAKQTEFQRDTGEFPVDQLDFCRFWYNRKPTRRMVL